MTDEISVLVREAVRARENAYCPYSGFRVGAALLSKSGSVFVGCNVENASFAAGSCAERVALGNAVANGELEFSAIAVCGGDGPCMPCGVCRQALLEFGDIDVYCSDATGADVRKYRLSDLLPEAFSKFSPDL